MGALIAAACAGYTSVQAGMLSRNYFRKPAFIMCEYCGKAPDTEQKEARCTSCGAPMKEKGKLDDLS